MPASAIQPVIWPSGHLASHVTLSCPLTHPPTHPSLVGAAVRGAVPGAARHRPGHCAVPAAAVRAADSAGVGRRRCNRAGAHPGWAGRGFPAEGGARSPHLRSHQPALHLVGASSVVTLESVQAPPGTVSPAVGPLGRHSFDSSHHPSLPPTPPPPARTPPQEELASHTQRAASKIELQEGELALLKERIR